MKVSASFLGSKNAGQVLQELNLTDVDYIHVDIMDGKYVPNKTIPLKELMTIEKYTKKRLDVHFMVENPLKLIDNFASLNIFCLTFHLDIKDNIEDILKKCDSYGIKKGIAINPNDNIEIVYPYLDRIDLVLVMSVNPGLPGQEFIKTTLSKINMLKEEIKKRNLNTLISVDGGINLENAKYLNDCDIIVSGSTILKSNNYQDIITKLREN